MQSVGKCINEVGNWSKLKKEHKFDNNEFKPSKFLEDLEAASPKLKSLIDKIQELDHADISNGRRLHKHFIYSDIKSGYGAKLIASGLAASGFTHAYHVAKGARGMSFTLKKDLQKHNGNVFATLTSVPFFEKPIGVNFRRELLKKFNSRPDNIYGEEIRIIILDSGFREGVDLFDIVYVHLFEPIVTPADQKQAIGRATRFCGQRGLRFHSQKGWPIYVHRYETIIPKSITHALVSQNAKLAPADTFFNLFMKFSNIDPRKLELARELDKMVIYGAVDRILTKSVHNFSIKEEENDPFYQEIFQEAGAPTPSHLNAFQRIQRYVRQNFSKYTWPKTTIENGCLSPPVKDASGVSILPFTPTQDFVRHYFTASSTVSPRGILLFHSVGTGKCHAKNTPILMHDGSVKMVQDVKVGDSLMGDDSTPRKVLSLASGIDDMYDVIPVKGDKYTVNSEHILCLKYSGKGTISYVKKDERFVAGHIDNRRIKMKTKRFKTKEEGEKYLEQFSEKDKIVEVEVKDYLNIPKTMKRELKGYRKGVEFEHKEVGFDPYIVGLWFGDGSKRGPVISNQESTVIAYLKRNLPKYGLTLNFQSGYDYRISGSGKTAGNPMLNFLKNYDLINNKHIPNILKCNDRQTRLKVLAGFLDTDGSYSAKDKCFEITQKLKTLADDILFLARSLGFAAYCTMKKGTWMYLGEKKSGMYHRIHISGNGLDKIPTLAHRKKALERLQIKDVLSTGIEVKHVGKGQYYGFTLDGNNRYLLGDFTVTHNTCSAIAVASSSFEESGYTIIYVTRHTLKADVWKNMFEQACSILIQDKVRRGEAIPTDNAKRMRLIAKSWMEPVSYKQFSNMIQGKNSLYEDLVKRNGKRDPLRKTLIIIDEAHKLYAPDVSGAEKPDTDVIKKMVLDSYHSSGKDSARVMLMTATPYTDDPMDMIRLLNLLRPETHQLSETFDTFAETYLDSSGKFTEPGKIAFLNEIAGYVSYLNRENDVRAFSYPVMRSIKVPMSEYEFDESLQQYITDYNFIRSTANNIKNAKSHLKRDEASMRERMSTELRKELDQRTKEYIKCKVEADEQIKEGMKEIKDMAKEELQECERIVKECQADVKENHADIVANLKERAKAERAECPKKDKECKDRIKMELSKELLELKEDLTFDKKQCTKLPDYIECKTTAKEKERVALQDIKEEVKQQCEKHSPTALKLYEKIRKEAIEHEIKVKSAKEQKKIDYDEKRLAETEKHISEVKKQIEDAAKVDASQRSALENCLKTQKVKPAYKSILKGDFPDFIDDEEIQNNSNSETGDSSNIYIVNGHGAEKVINFNKRTTMPKDKVLIVFPVCARPAWMNVACKFSDMFVNPKYFKWFADPLKYKSMIERTLEAPIRIYLPTEKVPILVSTLFYDFNLKKTVLMKSGVFPISGIPAIKRENLESVDDSSLQLGSSICSKYIGMIENPTKYTAKTHHEVFKGNVFKPAGALNTYNTLKYRRFDIQDVLKEVGPGIYYYTGCRSSDDKISTFDYNELLDQSHDQQKAKERSAKLRQFKEIVPIVKPDFNREVSPMNATPNVSPVPENSKSPDKTKQNTPIQKIIKREDNSPEEKRRITEIVVLLKLEVEKIAWALHGENEISHTRIDGKIMEWERDLEAMKQTFRVASAKEQLNVLKALRSQDVVLHETIASSGESATVDGVKKNFVFLYTALEVVIARKRHRVGKKLLGVVPEEMSLKDKCDKDTIVRRIKKIHKLGLLHKLVIHKKTDPYFTNTKAFSDLCKKTRNLMIKER